jgi:hypothetical protein
MLPSGRVLKGHQGKGFRIVRPDSGKKPEPKLSQVPTIPLYLLALSQQSDRIKREETATAENRVISPGALDLKSHLDYILRKFFFACEAGADMMKPVKVNPLVKMVTTRLNRLVFKPDAFSFGRKIEDSQSVLICMPADIDRFAMARDLLSSFVQIFEGRKIFVLLPFLEARGYLSDSPQYRVISAIREDLNVLSLPGKRFIQRLKRYKFDVSLDLDIGDGFFNRYLCLKCKIPLRIGPKRKNTFPLYNIQLAVVRERLGSREIYEGMARTLRTLFAPTDRSMPDTA